MIKINLNTNQAGLGAQLINNQESLAYIQKKVNECVLQLQDLVNLVKQADGVLAITTYSLDLGDGVSREITTVNYQKDCKAMDNELHNKIVELRSLYLGHKFSIAQLECGINALTKKMS